jgi:hypothetical protein
MRKVPSISGYDDFELDSVNPVLYPSIDTILIKLCVLLTISVASATAERLISVLDF